MDFKKFNLYLTAVKIPLDIIAIFSGFFLAYYLRYREIGEKVSSAMPFSVFVLVTSFIVVVWIIIFALSKLYEFRKKSFIEEAGLIFVSITAGMMILFTILFFSNNNSFSRLIIAYSWLFTFAFVLFERLVLKIIEIFHFKSEKGKIKVLILGSGSFAEEVIESFSLKNSRYRIVGVLSDKKNSNSVLGKTNDFKKVLKEYKINEVIQADPEIKQEIVLGIINFCHQNGISYKVVSGILPIKTKNIVIEAIGGVPIIEIRRSPLDGWGQILKRIIDIIGSLIAIIVFSPLFLIISLLIKVTSKGPVLFRQERVGKNSKRFTFLKFRSMYFGAHKEHEKMIKKHGNMFKLKKDPRVTNIGFWLRKTSLDELPQFFNVFKGDMSLVGPRPPMPEEVKRYTETQKRRLGFKPGITGLWQVSGRSDVSFKEWVKLDVYYIENWSLLLDLHIILKTFLVFFTKKGAY